MDSRGLNVPVLDDAEGVRRQELSHAKGTPLNHVNQLVARHYFKALRGINTVSINSASPHTAAMVRAV